MAALKGLCALKTNRFSDQLSPIVVVEIEIVIDAATQAHGRSRSRLRSRTTPITDH
jgi:hypothetical protein